jgi:hypothetical protein
MKYALLGMIALVFGCSNTPAPVSPHVDDLEWCYAASRDGRETFTCADSEAMCATLRVRDEADPGVEAISCACHSVHVDLVRQ